MGGRGPRIFPTTGDGECVFVRGLATGGEGGEGNNIQKAGCVPGGRGKNRREVQQGGGMEVV